VFRLSPWVIRRLGGAGGLRCWRRGRAARLDCDAGTLTVKKNGVRLGVAFTGLTGELCWAASLYYEDNSVQIGAVDAAAAGW
jgi:hypothetical protein